jgi:hypothetical protein
MNRIVAAAGPGRTTKALAVLTVACFWLLPLSPIVAIGAVSLTRDTENGWRRIALTGAALCSVYTIFLAILVASIYLRLT